MAAGIIFKFTDKDQSMRNEEEQFGVSVGTGLIEDPLLLYTYV